MKNKSVEKPHYTFAIYQVCFMKWLIESLRILRARSFINCRLCVIALRAQTIKRPWRPGFYGLDDFNKIARRSCRGTITWTTEGCCGYPFIYQTDLVPCHRGFPIYSSWQFVHGCITFTVILYCILKLPYKSYIFILRIIRTIWLNMRNKY